MKKLFLLFTSGLIVGFWVGFDFLKTDTIPQGELVSANASHAQPPQTLRIPRLGVNASVESVGLTPEGNMGVPKNAGNVGWYNLGYKLGENGSVVLAGHLDDVYGQPAVFYNLSRLQVGDEIFATDQNGKEYRYRVTRKVNYPYNQLPLQEVFVSNDKARLNLITCQGVFDRSQRNYTHRIVVYSEIVE